MYVCMYVCVYYFLLEWTHCSQNSLGVSIAGLTSLHQEDTEFTFWGPLDTMFFHYVRWKVILELLAIEYCSGQPKFYDDYGLDAPLPAAVIGLPEA